METLKNPFLRVGTTQGNLYGGNQMLLPRRYVRKVGCGVVAALNLLLYLEAYDLQAESGRCCRHLNKQGQLSLDTYNQLAEYLRHRYIPVIPWVGVVGYALPFGLNLYFCRHKIPYRAIWCVSKKKLWKRMEAMLKDDKPVILSIGPNWPNRWGKSYLSFYQKDGQENYRRVTRTRAHYVTVTGMDDTWLKISSWGKKYYINRQEYDSYVRSSSNYVFSNLVLLIKR